MESFEVFTQADLNLWTLRSVRTLVTDILTVCGVPMHLDGSYRRFHRLEDFPIVKYLQQPLYFEVELMSSTNPQVSLELENCWATLAEDKVSQPRWDLIING